MVCRGGNTPTVTYREALRRAEAAEQFCAKSRADYLTAKATSGTHESSLYLVQAALMLAEAACLEYDAHEVLEDVVVDEMAKEIAAERKAAK